MMRKPLTTITINNDPLVINTWSDEAREASAEARRLKRSGQVSKLLRESAKKITGKVGSEVDSALSPVETKMFGDPKYVGAWEARRRQAQGHPEYSRFKKLYRIKEKADRRLSRGRSKVDLLKSHGYM